MTQVRLPKGHVGGFFLAAKKHQKAIKDGSLTVAWNRLPDLIFV